MSESVVRVFLVVLILTSINISFAQKLGMRVYTIEDGMPHTNTGVLLEDSLGYLWCATFGGGVARFDGRNFETFDELDGLAGGIVTGMQFDFGGRLWVSTPEGISKFDGHRFKTFRQKNIFGFLGVDVFDHRDTIYAQLGAVNDLQFSIIVGDSVLQHPTTLGLPDSAHISNVFAKDRSTLYINLANGEVWKKTNRLSKVADSLFVDHFFMVRDELYFLARGTIYQLKGDDRLYKKYEGIEGRRITVADDFSYGWTQQGRVFRKIVFKDRGWEFADAATPTDPSYVLIDAEGNDWFSTYGNGLFKYYRQSFVKAGPTDVSTFSINEDDHRNFWIGTKNGIEVLDSSFHLSKRITFGDPNRDRIVKILRSHDGLVWIATNNGIAKMEGGKTQWFTVESGLKHGAVRDIEEDNNGTIWIGYFHRPGLSFILKKDRSHVEHFTDSLTRMLIWDIKAIKETKSVFFCSRFGIFKLQNGKITKVPIPEFSGKMLMTMGIYRNKYLLVGGSGTGLGVVDLESNQYSILTTRDGIASNSLMFAEGAGDSIWIGTVRGIDVITLTDDMKIRRIIRHHGESSGLKSGGLYLNSAWFSQSGKYFGLVDGVYRLNEHTIANSRSFPLHFKSIRVGDQDIGDSSQYVEVAYDRNRAEFHFNQVNKSSSPTRFKYFLKGWDPDWTQTSNPQRISYTNLSPGNYVFRVMSTNAVGEWTNEISYSFQIKPPFYQTAFFKLLIVACCTALIVLISYYRTRSKVRKLLIEQNAREQEALRLRKEIGRDFHDEMGNQLARIINYIGLLKINNIKSKYEMLDKAEQTAKYLLTGTKDFLWSIDPVNDNLESLQVHMRDFGDKLLTEKGIDFKFYSSIDRNPNLPFGFTRQVNLIFKEALTNLFKHSGSKSASLRVDLTDDILIISLEDRGVGLTPFVETNGEGIRNMKNRAARLGGELNFINQETGGLTVRFTYTVKNNVNEFSKKSIHH
jgi:signal transduction histidine kinase/ligand-binding sensor domain-containing protein